MQSVGCLVELYLTGLEQAIWLDNVLQTDLCYFALLDVSSRKLLKYDLILLQNMN